MKDKSETSFGFKPESWYVPPNAIGEELVLNELGYKPQNLLNFRNFSWCWDKTESICGGL